MISLRKLSVRQAMPSYFSISSFFDFGALPVRASTVKQAIGQNIDMIISVSVIR